MKYWIIIALLVVGCSREESPRCWKRQGAVNTDFRPLPSFRYIDLQDKIDLVLIPSTENEAAVLAGDKLQDYLITEVVNDTLIIRDDNTCDWLRKFDAMREVRLKYTDLTGIFYQGAGNVTCTDTIRSVKFGVESLHGAGTVDLDVVADTTYTSLVFGPANIAFNGRADIAYAYSLGFGTIDFSNLESRIADVNNANTSVIRVNPSAFLICWIQYLGDVYYHQQPDSIKLDDEGDGELIPAF